MCKALPRYPGWDRFVEAWEPSDLILISQQKVHDWQRPCCLNSTEKDFPDTKMPLLYHPKNTWKQNIMVPVPGMQRKKSSSLMFAVIVKIVENRLIWLYTSSSRVLLWIILHSSWMLVSLHASFNGLDPLTIWLAGASVSSNTGSL